MTNEELAELERRIVAGYEGGEKTDDGSQSWGLGFEAGVRAALIATAREAEALRAENALWKERFVSFAAVWGAQWAREHGLPDGHLHPNHYDLLKEAGANLQHFTCAALEQGEVK